MHSKLPLRPKSIALAMSSVLPVVLYFALATLAVKSMAEELVSLPLSDDIALTARLQRSGAWPGGQTVLLLHGTLSHRDTEIIQSQEALFAEAGISTLAPNLSLSVDRREGPADCAAPQRHSERDASEEIALWLDWLAAQGVEDITLSGHSRGGNQIARYLLESGDDRVARAVLIAPPRWRADAAAQAYEARYERSLASVLAGAEAMRAAGEAEALLPQPVGFLYCGESRVTAAGFLSYYEEDPLRDTPTLLDALALPVLVVAGSEDDIAVGLAGALAGAKENVTLREIDGADHFFRDFYADDLVAEALDFMAETP